MHSIGDIIEQDGQQVRVVDVQEQIYEDGSKVTIITTEPVV